MGDRDSPSRPPFSNAFLSIAPRRLGFYLQKLFSRKYKKCTSRPIIQFGISGFFKQVG